MSTRSIPQDVEMLLDSLHREAERYGVMAQLHQLPVEHAPRVITMPQLEAQMDHIRKIKTALRLAIASFGSSQFTAGCDMRPSSATPKDTQP